jgi:hypothetical protein
VCVCVCHIDRIGLVEKLFCVDLDSRLQREHELLLVLTI